MRKAFVYDKKHSGPDFEKWGASPWLNDKLKILYESYLSSFPPTGSVEIRDLIKYRIASPIVLFYQLAFCIVLIAYCITGVKKLEMQRFLVPASSPPKAAEATCSSVLIPTNGIFNADYQGKWPHEEGYDGGRALYQLKLNGATLQQSEFKETFAEIKESFKRIGAKMAKSNLNYQLLVLSSYRFYSEKYQLEFYPNSDATYLLGVRPNFAIFASSNLADFICNGTNMIRYDYDASTSSYKISIILEQYTQDGYYLSNDDFGYFNKLIDEVSNYREKRSQSRALATSSVANIFVEVLCGPEFFDIFYDFFHNGKDEDLTVNVDVRTIATILAINLGVFKIRDSGLNRVDEFAESAVFPEEIRDKGHFYVDEFYKGMKPIFCVKEEFIDPNGADVCFYSNGINLFYPVSTVASTMVFDDTKKVYETSMCNCDGEGKYQSDCNKFEMLFGLVFYPSKSTSEDHALKVRKTFDLGLRMQKKTVGEYDLVATWHDLLMQIREIELVRQYIRKNPKLLQELFGYESFFVQDLRRFFKLDGSTSLPNYREHWQDLCGPDQCTMMLIDVLRSYDSPVVMNPNGILASSLSDEYYVDQYSNYKFKRVACANLLDKPTALATLSKNSPVALEQAYLICTMTTREAFLRALGIAAGSAQLYATIGLSIVLTLVLYFINSKHSSKLDEVKPPAVKRELQDNATRLIFQKLLNDSELEDKDQLQDIIDKCFDEHPEYTEIFNEHYASAGEVSKSYAEPGVSSIEMPSIYVDSSDIELSGVDHTQIQVECPREDSS